MQRFFMILLAVVILTSMWLSGCGVSDDYVPIKEYDELQQEQAELQTQVETLEEELNQLKEQKRTEILQQADAYYAIVELSVSGSSEPTGIQPLTAEAIVGSLTASSKFWSLIKATKDPELISRCQPQGEWNVTPCSCYQVKDYCWSMYKKLIAEYNELQPAGGQFIIPKLPEPKPPVPEQPVEKTEEKAITPEPVVDVTIVVEYEGEWAWQSQRSWVWRNFTSGNNSRVLENKLVPVEWWACICDGGTDPLVLKILYEGQAVAEDTAIGQNDVAYVFWEGPQ